MEITKMDNLCVCASFIVGIILCQIPEIPYGDITALGLVALTVYYFLYRFNSQMQELSEQNKLIMQRQELDNNTHNKALERIADGFEDLSSSINSLVQHQQELEEHGKRE